MTAHIHAEKMLQFAERCAALEDELEMFKATEHSMLILLADIRTAAGDKNGKLMQPELVELIAGLKQRAEEAEAERDDYANACEGSAADLRARDKRIQELEASGPP